MNANRHEWMPWAAGAALLVLLGATVLPSSDAEEGVAEGGSPLYETVVSDAVARLARREPDRSRPAAAGEICPDCGQVHAPRQRAAADRAAAIGHGIVGDHAVAPPPGEGPRPPARRPPPAARPQAQPQAQPRPPAARPAEPAPVVAGEPCPDCGQIHGVRPPPVNGEPCPDCGQVHGAPLPQPLSLPFIRE